MREYSFKISGNPVLCQNLSETRMSYFFDIYGGVSDWHDCPNDDYRLRSIYLQLEGLGIEDIWQVGFELISLFNGMQKVYTKDIVVVK